MTRLHRLATIVALAAMGTWVSLESSAAPISTAMNAPSTGSEATPFAVSSTDIGQTNGTWSLVSGTANFSSDVTKLNDGGKYGGLINQNTLNTFAPSDGTVALLTFDGPVNVDSIVSLTGTGGTNQFRSGQAYTVDYSTDGVNFNFLHTVGGEANNSDGASNETQVTIFDPGAVPIAMDVEALRFTFTGFGTLPEKMYREFDVFGTAAATAAVPEPQSIFVWSILGMLGATLTWWGRKSQS